MLALQVPDRPQDASELGYSPVWVPKDVVCLFEPSFPHLNEEQQGKLKENVLRA